MNSLLLGPFTEEERTRFIADYVAFYRFRHPEERPSFAQRQARQAWRRKVYRALKKSATIEK